MVIFNISIILTRYITLDRCRKLRRAYVSLHGRVLNEHTQMIGYISWM